VLKSYPDGKPQEVAVYEWQAGERNLVQKNGYYQNGATSFVEKYRAGQLAEFRSWWRNGTLRHIRLFEDSILVRESSFDSDGVRQLAIADIDSVISKLTTYPGEPATAEDTVTMVTSAGTIKLRLFSDVAPVHCDNFKRLANFGFYDSTTFHRIVPGFVIQGGDIFSRDTQRANDGQGGPGYMIPAEFNPRPHRKGTLAMARSRDPNSAGSQFYIALKRLTQLDNRYTVFGEVIEGLAVVDSIAITPTDSRDTPLQPQRILRVRVESRTN
jgi:cyclophilin family peptidyl-prolyl cis-trans isomerase